MATIGSDDVTVAAPRAARPSTVASRLGTWIELGKPRVVVMVLVTTLVGYHVGAAGDAHVLTACFLLLGTAAAAAGTLALNEWMEHDLDARMARTRGRPIPSGRLGATEGCAVGAATLAVGLAILGGCVGPGTALVEAAIATLYLAAYTPLKRVTPFCSVVGAVPGALPPVAGWAAGASLLSPEPWVLFAIMFLWQIPHTLAIGCLYRDDYARAGIRVLPVVDVEGGRTGLHSLLNALALVPVALLPSRIGLTGPAYSVVALALGGLLVWTAADLARTRSRACARRLMLASLVYLPVLLAALALDAPAHLP